MANRIGSKCTIDECSPIAWQFKQFILADSMFVYEKQ
jgi:hypothetical protein